MPIFTKQLRFNAGNTQEAVREIANHIRFMQEELEYRLTNLDSSNITSINADDTKLEGGGLDDLTQLAQTVGDLNTSYSSLRQSVGSLSATISEQGQSLSTLKQTSDTIEASVRNLQTGEKTYLRMDSTGVSVTDGTGSLVKIGKGNLTLTGAITWADLDSTAQGQVNAANSTASNAVSVAQSIANGTYAGTFINGTSIYSPTIYGNVFSVLPRNTADTSGSFNLYGYHGASLFQFLQIQYASATPPYINFTSPGGAYAQFNFSSSQFYGAVCMHSSYGTALPANGTTGQVFFLIS